MSKKLITVVIGFFVLAIASAAIYFASRGANELTAFESELKKIEKPILPPEFDALYKQSENGSISPADSKKLAKLASETADKVEDYVQKVEAISTPSAKQAEMRQLILQWSRKAERMRDVAATGR